MKTFCPVLLALLLLPMLGCVTKSKAKAQAEAAFQAGWNQAMREHGQQQEPSRHPANAITVRGDVRNSTILWTEGLTLSQAIVQAVYTGLGDPKLILIHRQGQTQTVQPGALLSRRQDPLLLPRDVVDLVR